MFLGAMRVIIQVNLAIKTTGFLREGGGEPKCPPLSLPPPPLKAALEDFIQLEVELGIF